MWPLDYIELDVEKHSARALLHELIHRHRRISWKPEAEVCHLHLKSLVLQESAAVISLRASLGSYPI
jgi:hypothetical protein